MATVDQKLTINRTYAQRLGWTPKDFGQSTFGTPLLAAIEADQAKLGFTGREIDAICGPMTLGRKLGALQAELVTGFGTSVDKLADAGVIAVCEAKRLWLQNVIDLPPDTHPDYPRCRQIIDRIIRSTDGIHWDWEEPYQSNGQFEWCGAFVGYAWRAAGMKLALRRSYFSSNYRLDRWGRYQPFETTPNPKPAQGPYRMIIELGEKSNPSDAVFPDGTRPRMGDILLVGGVNTAYGKHITLVESFDPVSGVFTLVEGNATGLGPSGHVWHGVIRAQRPIGLHGFAPTTYHARRVIRPALPDLIL